MAASASSSQALVVHPALVPEGDPDADAREHQHRLDPVGDVDHRGPGQRGQLGGADGVEGQQQRLLHRVDQALGDGHRLGLVSQLAAEDAELVTAQAGGEVARPQHALDPAGDLGEHVVAGPMPVVVVDGLEAVQVEVQDGHQVAVAVQLTGQVAEELGPVGKAGQRVVAGRVR